MEGCILSSRVPFGPTCLHGNMEKNSISVFMAQVGIGSETSCTRCMGFLGFLES